MQSANTVARFLLLVSVIVLLGGDLIAETPVRRSFPGPQQLSGTIVWAGGCGDGVLDVGEECDPGIPGVSEPNLGGKTCESEGYSGGELACTAAGRHVGCKLDRSGCTCESSGTPAPVPKTGQTTCWDQDGRPIDCAGTGQDGEYQKGVTASPRFTDNNNGTVTDNLTGLIWLKDANCFGRRTWAEALSDANDLASGSCGLTDGSASGDWRLPNVRELHSLIDFQNFNPTFPTGHPFSGVQSDNYWSSTTYAGSPRSAWAVYLFGGNVQWCRPPCNDGSKTLTIYVWPVRGGQ